VYYVYVVLRVILPTRKWAIFSRLTKSYNWNRLHLAPTFKRKNDNMTLEVKIHIDMLKIWWIQAKMEHKGSLCFAVLQGDAIPSNSQLF